MGVGKNRIARAGFVGLGIAILAASCSGKKRNFTTATTEERPLSNSGGPVSSTPVPAGLDGNAPQPVLEPPSGSAGGFTWSPAILDFNAVTMGTRARANLELNNASEPERVVPTPQLGGPNAEAFSVEVNECPPVLGVEEVCTMTLGFEPRVEGEHIASLAVGDAIVIPLSGTGLRAGSLVLGAAEAVTADFGSMTVGERRVQAFTLTNAGGTIDSLTALTVSNPREFSIVPGPESCEASVTQLEVGQSCSIQVQFTPAFAGVKNATLSATGASGSTSLALTGTGLRVAELIGDRLVDFGATEVNSPGSARVWHIVNVGQTSTGVLSLSNSNAADFAVAGTCTMLAPGEACDLTITFNPQQAGYLRTTLTLADSGGTQITLTGQGEAQFRLTVTVTGPGTVIGTDGTTLDCRNNGAVCSALVGGRGAYLRATPTNGSNSIFAGWSGADCEAPQTTCEVKPSASPSVTARFTPVANNLVFVTSNSVSADQGSARAYDGVCNQLATDAGINNRTGDEFVAMVSDSTTTFLQRLGSARGWVRMDGRPFTDRFTDLINDDVMYYPARYDEHGGDAYSRARPGTTVWTGTELDGLAALDNCADWRTRSTQENAKVGNLDHAPGLWTGGLVACDGFSPVVCLGRTQTAALIVPRSTGKRIWVTNTGYTPGSMTPDAKCQLERPAGVAQARALVSYTNRAASEQLVPTANYVRPDGQLVGTGAQIASLDLITAPWLSAANLPLQGVTWVGSDVPSEPGTAQTTCNDWSSTGGTASTGVNGSIMSFWDFFAYECNSTDVLMYCVEP